MRWRCPKCGFGRAWRLVDRRRKCRRCSHRFTPQTIWDACRLPQKAKRQLLDYFVLGVPAYRLRFKLFANLDTIEKFFLTARAAASLAEECEPILDGLIECDEAMFGGHRKGKRGWGARGKVLVFGMLKRNGKVRVVPVASRETATLIPLIQEHTRPGSLYYSDDWHAYGSLRLRGNHVVVKKEDGRPKGRDHINGIEGFWSYAKHWLYQYRGVPRKFFPLYLGEISFRFNHRENDLFPLIYKLLQSHTMDDIKRFLVRN